MSLEEVLARFEGRAVTHVAADVTPDVTAKPAPILGCTAVTPVTAENPPDWRALDKAYQLHHVNCKICQAAGRGSQYGQRCEAGMALWRAYDQGFRAERYPDPQPGPPS